MRWTWIAFWVIAGCGPRIVVDEDGGPSESSSGDPPSPATSTASSDSGGDVTTGIPPDPLTTGGTTFPDPTGGESTTAEPDLPCPELEKESARCIFLVDSTVHVVGMDSGQWCPVVGASDPIGASTIVWDFESIYLCNREDDNRLVSVDLASGLVTSTEIRCGSIVDASGLLLVEPDGPEPWGLYSSFADVLNGTRHDLVDIDPYAGAFTTLGSQLFGAWHVTDSVELWDIDNDAFIHRIPLEDYGDWVHGLSIVNTRLAVLGVNDTILLFDPDTGERVGELPLDGISLAEGLACR